MLDSSCDVAVRNMAGIYQTLRAVIYITRLRNDDNDEDDDEDDDNENACAASGCSRGRISLNVPCIRQRGQKRSKNRGTRARACNPTDVAFAKSVQCP